MAMTYKGELSYITFSRKDNKYVGGPFVAISSFSVVGGSKRTINLKATSDFSISTEFEQARQYKNITLFMPPTQGGDDMQVALQLSENAAKNNLMILNLNIEKFTNGKRIAMFRLMDWGATLKKPPQIVAEGLLMIEVSLGKAEIGYGEGDKDADFIGLDE
ncbi:MAG: hypothetical protein AB1757_25480 [Acidobacteriota bacterium]